MAPSSRTSSLRSSPLHTPRTSAAPPTIALPPCSLAPAPSPSTTELLYGEAPVESRSARRSKRKRARAHESSSSATSATTTHVGKTSSSCTTAATSTPRVADDVFSRVELFFNTSPSSPTTSSSTIFPRDISMLLMWSLPTSLPLIESPRRFLIKNKSRLRRVMMIYVNGWSYDKMMGTGAGLPRTTTTTTTDVKKDNDDDDEEEVWSERLCSAMLAPVRTQTCWARSGAGVQYAPLTLPNNMRVGLEEELMWMADLPRSANNNRHEQRNAASLQVQDEGLVDASRTTTSHDHARGVGSTFKRAMALVEEPASPDTPSCTPDASPTCASPTTQHVVPSTKVEEELAEKKVWENTTLLERFALRMPEHEGVLRDLGFIIDPAEYNNNNNNGNNAVGDDDVVVDAWSSFDPATKNNNNTSSSSPRVFAMDCEMVLVEGNESALARLTLVDLNQSCVVVDWLVQPTRPIIDYVTRFSGIDAEMLGPITTTLADCQAELKRWMNEESYLVGHSLENDLRACRMLPNCRILDSAWLFPHPSGLPFKNALRFLAKRYLHINIQRGSHDSAEDAIVSAQLVGLKMLRGDDFGRRRKVSVLEHMIHARIAEMRGGHEMDVGCEDAAEHPLKEVASAPPSLSVEEAKMRVQLFDEADTLVRLLPKDRQANRIIDVVGVRHDEDATRKVVRAWRQHQQPLQKNNTSKQNHGVVGQDDDDDDEGYIFMWVQLRDTAVDVVKPTSLTEEEQHLYETDQLERVAATNDRVMRMVESAPNNTLILILCAECGGESAGNHFSRAQGICFGFVKDDAARGPPPTTTDETPAPATTTGAPSSALDAPPPSSLATPPACQHQ